MEDRPRDEIEEAVSHNGENEEERTQKECKSKVEKELLLQQRQAVFITIRLIALEEIDELYSIHIILIQLTYLKGTRKSQW